MPDGQQIADESKIAGIVWQQWTWYVLFIVFYEKGKNPIAPLYLLLYFLEECYLSWGYTCPTPYVQRTSENILAMVLLLLD